MNATLQVEELNAGYGKVPVLRDVSFQVGEGEVVAIIGPNGAGKTTLLKTISGLIKPSSGEIRFRGQSIGGLAAHAVAKAGISHIPEGRRLFDNMTVLENLLMGAYAKRDNLKEGVLDEVFEIFPILKEREKQKAKDLSGGQKQMLALGRGLVSKPTLLMLDEPSLGLAPILVDATYDCAGRHGNLQTLTCAAGAVAALAWPAVLRAVMLLILEGDERVEVRVDHQIDVPALAAVTAVGAAKGDELFPAKGDRAVAPVAGFDIDSCLIVQHNPCGKFA